VISTTIIAGYLGAGKTTLVNHLLRHAEGKRVAVLVNDFGAVNIDADLIETRSDDILQLTGGCVCCSFGSDFVAALIKVTAASPTFDHIIVEASGVALPATIAASAALIAQVDVHGVIVLVDAETVLERCTDNYVGDTVLAQLEQADLLVLNKLDLVDLAEQSRIQERLEAITQNPIILGTTDAKLDPAVVFGPTRIKRSARLVTAPKTIRLRASKPIEKLFLSRALSLDRECELAALGQALVNAKLGIVRAKGFSRDATSLIQLTGKRVRISKTSKVKNPQAGTVICIALAAQFNPERFAQLALAYGANVTVS
jgi:G3E family GTPase